MNKDLTLSDKRYKVTHSSLPSTVEADSTGADQRVDVYAHTHFFGGLARKIIAFLCKLTSMQWWTKNKDNKTFHLASSDINRGPHKQTSYA